VVLPTIAVLSFIFGLTPQGSRLFEQLQDSLNRPGAVRIAVLQSRTKLLLVSTRERDHVNVAATVGPRGYSLLLAPDVATGIQKLLKAGTDVSVVIVDGGMRDSRALLQMAERISPAVRTIVLNPEHTATDTATLLLRNIQN